MAQAYELKSPDGRVFAVKPPQGASANEAEELAALRRHIDAQAGQQAGPNPVAPTGPVPEIRAEKPGVMPATTGLAERALTNPFAAPGGEQAARASSLARTVVPQTLGDVGMLAGMASLPVLRALPVVGRAVAKLPGTLGRIIMGAVGDEVGTRLAGGPAGQGALEGGLGGVIGEAGVGAGKAVGRGIVKVAGKTPVIGAAMARSRETKEALAKAAESAKKAALGAANASVRAANQALSRAKSTAERADALALKRRGMEERSRVMATSARAWEAIAESESRGTAQQLGQQLEATTLGTLKAQTGTELSNLGTFKLQNRLDLGKTMERTLKEAEGMVGADTKFKIPALAEENAALMDALGVATKEMKIKTLPPAVQAALEETYGPPTFDQFTLREISQRLTEIGSAGRYPSDVSAGATLKKAGQPAREQIKAVMSELEAVLTSKTAPVPQGPEAFATMRAGRHAFSVGNQMLAVLEKEGVFKRSETGALLELADLQRLMRPHLSKLKFRMTNDEYADLVKMVYPRAQPAAQATATLAGRATTARTAEQAVTRATEKTMGAEGRAIAARSAVPRAQVVLAEAEAARGKLTAPPADKSSWPFTAQELGQIYLDSAAQRTLGMMNEAPTVAPAP